MDVLNKLTIRHLKLNKRRTLVTIIGIMLSCALMLGIGLLISSARESAIESVKKYSGDQHAYVLDLSIDEYSKLLKNDKIDRIEYSSYLGFSEYEYRDSEYTLAFVAANEGYFKHLTLLEGRMPKNENEILIPKALNEKYKLGSNMNIELYYYYNGDSYIPVYNISMYSDLEKKENGSKSFKVVGIIENDIYSYYNMFNVITLNKNNYKDHMNCFLYMKKMKDTYDVIENITKQFNLSPNATSTNVALLELYGASKFSNLTSTMVTLLVFVLTILSIGCAIVIYNSFAISVMERKRQFGLLSSVGATKRQIRKTVFFEALVVGIIGMLLGIVASFLGIGLVILIINNLISDMLDTTLKLAAYPLFVIIPLIFMVITIFISVFIPAHRASKFSPVELLRQSDDIKIKAKKLKTPKFIRKIFGIEGEIALKNIKRNKKKYRITVLSLFVSIVLFITFSSYMTYMTKSADTYMDYIDSDAIINLDRYSGNKVQKFMEDIVKDKNVSNYMSIHTYSLDTSLDIKDKSIYTPEFYNIIKDYIEAYGDGIQVAIYEFDKDNYNKILNKIGKKEVKPILFNSYTMTIFGEDSVRKDVFNKYNNNFNKEVDLCEKFITSDGQWDFSCKYKIDDYYIANFEYYNDYIFKKLYDFVFIVPMGYFGDLSKFSYSAYSQVYLDVEDDTSFREALESKAKEYDTSYYYYNYSEEQKQTKSLLLALKILIYGFVVLVASIGVTSVFNTISTSMNLRKSEFAMLRSMGLTRHGFNKMLLCESLFFGLKSLLYALPVSFVIVFYLNDMSKSIVNFNETIIPWNSIIIAIVGVFVIVLISVMYSTRKIKKENILEAIREENI